MALGVDVKTTKRCPLCGCRLTPSNRTKDHLIPKSIGGSSGYLNTWFMCKPCNNKKGDRLPSDREILAFCSVKNIPQLPPISVANTAA
jgi:5-methylcytosine-specific restriction endonuclease McrA